MNNQIKERSLKQKQRRAEDKRCWELVKNNPDGNHSQQVLDNCARHEKRNAQYKDQYKKRKLRGQRNSRERQRQLNTWRENSRNYRIRKKRREKQSTEETESFSSETRLNTNQSTNESPSVSSETSFNNENEANDVGNERNNETLTSLSGSVNGNVVNNITAVSTHQNLKVNNQTVSSDSISNNNTQETNVVNQNGNLNCTESTNLNDSNFDDNQDKIDNVILPNSRPLLQDSPTASPRKSSHVAKRQLNEENSSHAQELTQFDYSTLDNEENEIMIRLEDDLFLWNLPKGTRLCNNVLQYTLNIVRGHDPLVVKEASPTKLPEDIEAAFKLMLDVEINSQKEVFSKLVDRIEQLSMTEGNKIFGQPYYFGRKGRVLKEDFKKLTYREFLNPLQRFSSVTQTKRENLLESFSDDNCLNGYVYEIMLAHYLQHNQMACVSCQNKTLLWNGGSDYPWMDVVCTSCDSTYEIKSKKDFETARALFKGNRIEGGCFRSFFNIARKYQDRENTKHFLIVIGREVMNDDDSGESFCKCIVGPIVDVLPIINPKTFANVQHPKLRSRIITSSYVKIWRIYGTSFSGPTSESTWKTVASTYLNNHPGFE